jgi:carbon storage regulator
MLVLSREVGERILIGDNVVVTIVRIGPVAVRVGIEAPAEINIVREELTPECSVANRRKAS